MSVTLGIDPGLDGAIGLLCNKRYAAVWSMPTGAKRSKRAKGRRIEAQELVELAAEIAHTAAMVGACTHTHTVAIALEAPSAMPQQGVVSMFQFGDSCGCARMLAALVQVEISRERIRRGVAQYPDVQVAEVAPAKWKREMMLMSTDAVAKKLARGQRNVQSKKHALKRARQMFPDAPLPLEEDDGKAEALLLARWMHNALDQR